MLYVRRTKNVNITSNLVSEHKLYSVHLFMLFILDKLITDLKLDKEKVSILANSPTRGKLDSVPKQIPVSNNLFHYSPHLFLRFALSVELQ